MIRQIKDFVNAKNLKLLQTFTVVAFILGIVSLFYVEFSLSLLLLTVLMYFLHFGFGVSLTFHRSLTHRSVQFRPWVEFLGKFFASMGGTGSPISWILTHRAHHKYSDTDQDPHPPHKISTTLMGQYPKVAARGMRKYAESRFNRIMHRYYFLVLGVYALSWALLGSEFFFYGFLYPVLLTVMASNFVNKYAHSDFPLNYRPYDTRDTSQNSPIVAWLTWGEGWHNTHHKFPGRASFSMNSREVDLSFHFAVFLEKFGLAKIQGTNNLL